MAKTKILYYTRLYILANILSFDQHLNFANIFYHQFGSLFGQIDDQYGHWEFYIFYLYKACYDLKKIQKLTAETWKLS